MVDLKEPEINDLIIYKDDDSLFLSRIKKIFTVADIKKVQTDDITILRNSSIGTDKVPHVIQIDYEITLNNIFRNFGNITLEGFKEDYPEWLI